jgi:hypothetical protein
MGKLDERRYFPYSFGVKMFLGEVSEWSKEHDWKSCAHPKGVPWVRIPPSPLGAQIPLFPSRLTIKGNDWGEEIE